MPPPTNTMSPPAFMLRFWRAAIWPRMLVMPPLARKSMFCPCIWPSTLVMFAALMARFSRAASVPALNRPPERLMVER
ncbi:hypothetical protein D9M69_673530 [compost metagenome]